MNLETLLLIQLLLWLDTIQDVISDCLVSVETCVVLEYVVSFGKSSMSYWESYYFRDRKHSDKKLSFEKGGEKSVRFVKGWAKNNGPKKLPIVFRETLMFFRFPHSTSWIQTMEPKIMKSYNRKQNQSWKSFSCQKFSPVVLQYQLYWQNSSQVCMTLSTYTPRSHRDTQRKF